jgi:hypothetical protein
MQMVRPNRLKSLNILPALVPGLNELIVVLALKLWS